MARSRGRDPAAGRRGSRLGGGRRHRRARRRAATTCSGTVGTVTVVRAPRRGATPPTTRSSGSSRPAPTRGRDLGRRAGRARARAGRRGRRRGNLQATARIAAVSEEGLRASVEKMRAEGVADAAIRAFEHYYRQLEARRDGADARGLDRAGRRPAGARRRSRTTRRPSARRCSKAIVLRLNGGLGTSMGLTQREVAARGQGRAELPRHHRPPGAGAARASTTRGCRWC